MGSGARYRAGEGSLGEILNTICKLGSFQAKEEPLGWSEPGEWSENQPRHFQAYFLCPVLQTTWADQFLEPLPCDMKAATSMSAFDAA